MSILKISENVSLKVDTPTRDEKLNKSLKC